MGLSDTALTAVEAFTTNLYPPNPGTTIQSSDVSAGEQVLLNRTLYLEKNQNFVRQTPDEATYLALLNECLTDYDTHIASAVFHTVADVTNTVDTTAVVDYPTARSRANLLRTALLAHFNNGGGAYHTVADAVSIAALSAVPACDDVPTLVTLLRAIKAYFNAHRTQVGVHPVNDGVNVVASADPIVGTITGPIAITELIAPISDVQIFTANGTWTAPTSFTPRWIDVELIGGGGGGGSGAQRAAGALSSGGAGGGGGAVTRRRLGASIAGSMQSITIGIGGTGGASVVSNSTNGNAGTSGTATTFGTLLRATGGGGGGGGTAGANSSGGSGGTSDSIGDTGGEGVNGSGGVYPGDASGAAGGGGGGGVAAGPTAFGGGAGGLNGGTAGTAAAGGGNTGGAGTAGSASIADNPGHGGGGGGANAVGAGGNGGAGGTYGGGGGGGGSSVNGSPSGAGGSGASGFCRVISVP